MLSVNQAKKILFENVKKLSAVKRSVSEVSGYVSADNIKSPVDLPLFDHLQEHNLYKAKQELPLDYW